MRERPDGADLLANALGIAERPLRHGDAPAREEHKVLAALLRQDGTLARVRESAPKALAAWDQG